MPSQRVLGRSLRFRPNHGLHVRPATQRIRGPAVLHGAPASPFHALFGVLMRANGEEQVVPAPLLTLDVRGVDRWLERTLENIKGRIGTFDCLDVRRRFRVRSSRCCWDTPDCCWVNTPEP